MLCEKCKIREANIQYTEIINGVQRDHHFCTQCAREMENNPYGTEGFEGEFPFAKFLSSLLGEVEKSARNNQTSSIVCPNCRTSYDEFISSSKFGCKECYEVFGILIADNIKQLQGSDIHKGKKPKYMKAQSRVVHIDSVNEVDELKRRLGIALEEEEYELAAEYRDKIKELEKEQDE